MPTIMKTGLSGGAASNNINVVHAMTGIRLVRSAVFATGASTVRAVFSRINNLAVSVASPYTLATS